MKVTFLHPDLGIGGAERLVVDAALALQTKGHNVTVVTSQFDRAHSFKETEDLDIRMIKWFPRDIFGRFFAFCAYMRMCLAALYICFYIPTDVIICDQVSASLAVFRLLSSSRRIFYCHYPDLLLTERKSSSKKFYRMFLDWVEEHTTGLADTICVNSLYTSSVVRKTFPTLADRRLTVVYPSLNTAFFDDMDACDVKEIPISAKFVFLSLNRFEVKKGVSLAIEAFAELRNLLSDDIYNQCFLVIAGGYDRQNRENAECYINLQQCAIDCRISERHIAFMRSPSDATKVALLRRCTAVLYTPQNEHFGIVPVEAMYLGKPVIAVNSGGPLESIENGRTGFLLEARACLWARTMERLIREANLLRDACTNGPERVKRLFAFDTFASRLDDIVNGRPTDNTFSN